MNYFAWLSFLPCFALPVLATFLPTHQEVSRNTDNFDSCNDKFDTAESNLNNNEVEQSAGCSICQSSLKFEGAAAKKYSVQTQIPTLPFKTKNSWAGLMPISQNSNDTYYFWLWGKDSLKPSRDIVIWLQGGPDCSGLLGMITQNGPFVFPAINGTPHVNNYSWTRAVNMLYVEQPIGNGFTTGTVTDQDHAQFADQFDGFLDHFFRSFPELKGSNVFFAGESYAGVYINFIISHQYARGNKYNVKGALIINGLISDPVAQTDLVAYNFAIKNADIIGLQKEDLAAIKKQSDHCQFTSYSDRYLTYPAKGKLPDIHRKGCRTFATFDTIARQRKADYNTYRITTPPPFPEVFPSTTPLDNRRLQTYINAPHQQWKVCKGAFNDLTRFAPSPDSYPSYSNNILKHVIEASTAGVIIMHGQQDGRIIGNGTAIVLQNLTWNGAQGFHTPPRQVLIDVDGKSTGTFVKERGLTFALVPGAGHMVDLDAPGTALAALESLLGQRSLSG